MAAPSVRVNFVNGALALPANQTDDRMVIVGPSSIGTPNLLYGFANASPNQVRTDLGYGPLPFYAAGAVSTQNHGAVFALPATATAGTTSTVTEIGTSTPDLTPSGSPTDAYAFEVEVVKPGTEAVAQVVWSADKGVTWSNPVGVAAPVTLGTTGLVATFAAGTYAMTHGWRFTTTAPSLSDTNIGVALQALADHGLSFGHLHVISSHAGADDAARATAFAATFAAVASRVNTFEASNRYIGCTLEAPAPVATDSTGLANWRNALTGSTYAALQNDRMAVCAGYHTVQSKLHASLQMRKSIGYSVVRRISQAPISEDLGRVRSGPLQDIISIEHDEDVSGGLDDARFITLRTIDEAFYVTNPRMFRVSGSDYEFLQFRRVIDRAARVARAAYMLALNDDFEVDRTTGRIDEAEAVRLDNEVTKLLRAALSGHISAVSARMSRTDDILRTRSFAVEVNVITKAYAKTIIVNIGQAAALAA